MQVRFPNHTKTPLPPVKRPNPPRKEEENGMDALIAAQKRGRDKRAKPRNPDLQSRACVLKNNILIARFGPEWKLGIRASYDEVFCLHPPLVTHASAVWWTNSPGENCVTCVISERII